MKQSKTLLAWWKRKFGYSSNDERYLTATLTQVLEDMADELAMEFRQEFETGNESTTKFLKKRAVDPGYDEKEAQRLANQLNAWLKSDDGIPK